jgi:Holliday junction resolvase
MSNAQRGHQAERWVRDELIALGYVVTRSAASAGAYDLIACGDTDIRLVSVKRTRRRCLNPSASSVAELRAAKGPVGSNVHKEVWVWIDREGWIVVRLTPDGYDHVPHPKRHVKRTIDPNEAAE